jgi:hypothetical protein
LRELAPRHYGRPTAQALVGLAKASISSGVAVAARSSSLRMLCDQLDHTQKNLEQLQREIDQLLDQDPKAKGMLSVPEFGPTTVAVLRAELGDLNRFTRIDQVVAYVGLDLQVKQSGKWKGQTKLSKHGSGRVRRILYLAALRSIHLQASPFGAGLSAPGGSWHEKGHGGSGSHAQNVDCRRPSDPDGGEVRSGESGRTGSKLAARLACCLYGAHPPTVEEAEPLDDIQRPGGMLCA